LVEKAERGFKKNWKIVTQKGDEQTTNYFDYVLVCNGHNSVPYYPKEVSGLENFEGNIIHSHNFRKPDCEEFYGRTLFVGSRWSGLDLLYQFVDNKRLGGEVDFNQIFITVPDPDYLSCSDNFKPFFENGRIKIKKGKDLHFSGKNVIFEDGSEEEIDTVLFCTGYQYKFPFLKDKGLITTGEDGRFFEPLYLKLFNINDPTLMFPGLSDGNPLIQVVMEKQIIVIKYFIEGKLILPYFEDMLKDLYKDKLKCSKVGLRKFFKGSVNQQWEYINLLQQLLKNNMVEKTSLNTSFNNTLKDLIEIFRDTVAKGNFIDFKEYDYKQIIPDGFEYDTTEYF